MKIFTKILLFLFIFLLYLILFNYKIIYNLKDKFLFDYNFNFKPNKKQITIEIDISGSRIGQRGPAKFVRGINEILPYKTNICNFISSDKISPINIKNKSNYFYFPFPLFSESVYNEWVNISKANKLILGPCFVPINWNNFPNIKFWKERRFRELLKTIKGLVIHSTKVKKYLSRRSNTSDLIKKFIIVRPCTNLMPKYINSFENRTIDIIFFEKYVDLNRRKQGIQLLNLFNNSSKKIKKMIYGRYNKGQMAKLANNSKFIIYFSFFDTGAIGLKEIQNYGVFAFTLQKDLVIDKKTSFYIPELTNENNMSYAFYSIMRKIQIVTSKHPNTQLIAKKNQEINKCQNALEDLCKSIL